MSLIGKYYILGVMLIANLLVITACQTKKAIVNNSPEIPIQEISSSKMTGGSSGMEQIDSQTYIVVYDLKNFQPGLRLGLVKVTEEELSVSGIKIENWDAEGISSDLESICRVPETDDEYFISESGNWQGNLGRIFHIKVDTSTLTAKVLGSVKIPMLHKNDIGLTGDQYEAMLSLPYDENKRIVILGERGGSVVNPQGVIRWGIFNILEHTFTMEGEGLKGIKVDVPGEWNNIKIKRSITDFHVDSKNKLWASASEDQGDSGPFYSVIYQLGSINVENKEKPFTLNQTISILEEVPGFKIEALSGSCKGIQSSHTFGTEDEIYGGVWRPIDIK